MTRVELIANRSIEENILEAIAQEKVGGHYTKYPGVLGVGNSGPRMGDPVWPEENIVFVFWCEEQDVPAIERAVLEVKAKFPDEGIKMYSMPGGQERARPQ
ncbi:MAG: hypothetical protein FWE09_03745 [Treponema sp.]|nr:hypothetical protein [Treponema sp.]